MTDYFVDMWRLPPRGLWDQVCYGRYKWELRAGVMNNAYTLSGDIPSKGRAYTMAGCRFAARRAKRKYVKYDNGKSIPREKI